MRPVARWPDGMFHSSSAQRCSPRPHTRYLASSGSTYVDAIWLYTDDIWLYTQAVQAAYMLRVTCVHVYNFKRTTDLNAFEHGDCSEGFLQAV